MNPARRWFSVGEMNRRWITDLTYMWTGEGYMYLAAMLGAHSRCLIGWVIGVPTQVTGFAWDPIVGHMRVALTLEALGVALKEWRPRAGVP